MPSFRASPDRAFGPLLCGVGAIVLWCFTGVCFASGSRLLGPMVFTTAISLVGFVTGAVLHRARGRPAAELFRMPLRLWAAAFAGIAVYTVLLVLAVGLAADRDVAQVVLVNYLWPVLILAFGLVTPSMRRQRWSRLLASGALGFCGVAVARGPDSLLRAPADLLPHALALAGAGMWAAYCVILRAWRVPDEQNASTAQWLLCAALAAIVGLARGEWASALVSPAAIGWALFCGVGPVGLAYTWWEVGMKRGPAHMIAALSFFIPIGSAALMGLWFRETLSPYLLAGAVMIATGSWLARHTKSRT